VLLRRFAGFVAVVCFGGLASCFLYGAEDDSEPLPPRTETPDANMPESNTPITDDGGVDSGANIADANTICNTRAAFTTVGPITEVNTPDDETHAHVTADELTLYLGRGSAIAVYTRDKKTDPWKGGVGMDVNGSNAQNVRVTDDTLRAYFDAYLGGGINSTRLITKSRPNTTTPWGGAATNRSFDLGTPDGINQVDPFIVADEKLLFFATDPAATWELAVTRKVNDTWQTPITLKGTSSPGGDRKPVVSADGSVIYFQSFRAPGTAGQGLIWAAHHVATSPEVFEYEGAAQAEGLAPKTPGSNSWPVWLSTDNCRLYFMSTREGGKGKIDLWLASRAP
jgi:hypothetical protein